MSEEEKSNLYVCVYSDYEEDFIFKESKYTLVDIHKLQRENQELKEQNKKYKEVIDKAIEYINSYDDGCYTDSTCKYKVAELNITKLLDILKESD